jgi:plastocyanin
MTINGANVVTTNDLPSTFSTISVAGQSNVVADSSGDTLTLVAGTGMIITTSASGDSITFSSDPALTDLSDVTITSPTDGQVLKYNAGTGQWINGTDLAGSGSTNAFSTISVAGQDNVVADSTSDTFNLVGGSGITITTDANTDSITITNSAASGATSLDGLSDVAITSVSSGQILVYTGSNFVNYTSRLFHQFAYPAITALDVTNSGSLAYLFNNQYSGNNPTIYAISGTTIAFNLNVASNHPFLIQTSGGVNYNTGLIHVATNGTVSTGTNAQGQTSGTLYWQIPAGTTGNYRYQCSLHPAMVGVITIKDISVI